MSDIFKHSEAFKEDPNMKVSGILTYSRRFVNRLPPIIKKLSYWAEPGGPVILLDGSRCPKGFVKN